MIQVTYPSLGLMCCFLHSSHVLSSTWGINGILIQIKTLCNVAAASWCNNIHK